MSKIISIANPKGGVGKTTTTINLAASLAIAEKRVLIIDLDPNGAVSLGLGLNHNGNETGIFEIFLGTADLLDSVQSYELLNMDIIPCNITNNEKETRLLELAKNRGTLKRKIYDLIRKDKLNYDYIIIDTPPALNDLTIAALSTSNSVIIPLQCGYYAIKVVERLMQMIRRLKISINPNLKIEGILLNLYDKGTKESRRAVDKAKLIFKDLVFNTVIPKNTTVGFASFEKKPVVLMDACASGSVAYLQLAKEILNKNELLNRFYQTQQLHPVIHNPQYHNIGY